MILDDSQDGAVGFIKSPTAERSAEGNPRPKPAARKPKPVARYFISGEDRDPPCWSCGIAGHGVKECPNMVCITCAQLRHPGQCKTVHCHHCGAPGHVARNCPIFVYNREEMSGCICVTCGEKGHMICLPKAAQTDLEVGQPQCSNCGSSDHSVRQCKDRYYMAPCWYEFAENIYFPQGKSNRGGPSHPPSRSASPRPTSPVSPMPTKTEPASPFQSSKIAEPSWKPDVEAKPVAQASKPVAQASKPVVKNVPQDQQQLDRIRALLEGAPAALDTWEQEGKGAEKSPKAKRQNDAEKGKSEAMPAETDGKRKKTKKKGKGGQKQDGTQSSEGKGHGPSEGGAGKDNNKGQGQGQGQGQRQGQGQQTKSTAKAEPKAKTKPKSGQDSANVGQGDASAKDATKKTKNGNGNSAITVKEKKDVKGINSKSNDPSNRWAMFEKSKPGEDAPNPAPEKKKSKTKKSAMSPAQTSVAPIPMAASSSFSAAAKALAGVANMFRATAPKAKEAPKVEPKVEPKMEKVFNSQQDGTETVQKGSPKLKASKAEAAKAKAETAAQIRAELKAKAEAEVQAKAVASSSHQQAKRKLESLPLAPVKRKKLHQFQNPLVPI